MPAPTSSLPSRRQAEVDKTTAEIEAKGRKSFALTSDVQNRKSLEALCADVLQHFGKVDILVKCAGTTKRRTHPRFS